MNTPAFVYFDLGKVLVDFDHVRGSEQLATLTDCASNEIHELIFQSDMQDRYESGQVSTNEFIQFLREKTGTRATDQQLRLAAGDIFDPIPEMFKVVKSLTDANVPIGVLSNTCEAHWDHLTKVARQDYPILDQFEVLVLSFEVGVSKPNPGIYESAIKRAGVTAEEIFFTDDLPANVAGAKSAGIDAIQFQSIAGLLGALKDRGLPIPA